MRSSIDRAVRTSSLMEVSVSGVGRRFAENSSDAFCIARFDLATLRKQGRNLFHSLILSFQGRPPQPVLSG